MLPPDIHPCLQGIMPSTMVSCSLDGVPNTTYLSQVYYVDETHVALSFQFFNKTIRNVRENPYVSVLVTDPRGFSQWRLNIRYDHSETDGDLYEQMEMQLEAVSSMHGLDGIFNLQAADIYEVLSADKLDLHEQDPATA
ncbi:MAG: pyridoxamine 5'-phosphate oxidase family protein [Chromatiales bacterium]|jgi:hypothetical protein|nr:pyridoxamine 5'-phosphate oxidase family protein [Chromatiales bacterium]